MAIIEPQSPEAIMQVSREIAHEPSELARAYRDQRVAAFQVEFSELAEAYPGVVAIVEPVDPKEAEPAPAAGITKTELDKAIDVTTGQALQVLGWQPGDGLPDANETSRRAKAGDFAGIGDVFTRSSEASTAWHIQTAYSPLALAPMYGDESKLHLPVLGDSGKAIRAGEPGRAIDKVMTVPEDDLARVAWRYHPDTLEVRRRGQHLQDIIVNKLSDQEAYPQGSTVRIAAIAGGAAFPDIMAAKRLAAERPDLNIQVDVFDFDVAALDLGVRTVQNEIFPETNFDASGTAHPIDLATLSADNLRVRFINQDITDVAALTEYAFGTDGELSGYDVVEGIGIAEYFPPEIVEILAAGMTAMLNQERGEGVLANMTRYHNTVQILGVIAWHLLQPRTLHGFAGPIDRAVGNTHQLRHEMLDSMSYMFTRWSPKSTA
jgi:hypothetical protein